jgi:tetratricopeptide (TPR) repeat protein
VTRPSTIAAACALALSCAIAAMPASGQPKKPPAAKSPTSQERAEASRLFNLGRIAFRAERYEEAILRWQESYALSEEPLILYNIGLAFEKLGDHAQAAENLRAWRDHAPKEEREGLDQQIAELERLAAESAPSPEPPEPPEPEPPPPEPPPPEEKTDVFAIAGFSLLAVGGAAVVAGIVMDIVAANNRPAEDDVCATVGGRLLCRADDRAAIESANELAIAGDVTWILGATIAAGGLAVLLFASDATNDEVAVLPIATPQGGAIVVTTTF